MMTFKPWSFIYGAAIRALRKCTVQSNATGIALTHPVRIELFPQTAVAKNDATLNHCGNIEKDEHTTTNSTRLHIMRFAS